MRAMRCVCVRVYACVCACVCVCAEETAALVSAYGLASRRQLEATSNFYLAR